VFSCLEEKIDNGMQEKIKFVEYQKNQIWKRHVGRFIQTFTKKKQDLTFLSVRPGLVLNSGGGGTPMGKKRSYSHTGML